MRIRLTIFLAALLACALAVPAQAATTRIGSVPEFDANLAPDDTPGGIIVQRGTEGTPYRVPSGYGVITGWQHRTGSTSGEQRLKVYRPTAAPDEYLTVGADARAVTAGARHTFTGLHIKVQPGDVIGLSSQDADMAYDTNESGDTLAFFSGGGDPPVGSTATTGSGGPGGFRLNVVAVVETDADGDGLGDDSQDNCPTVKGACPASYPLPTNPTPAADTVASRFVGKVTITNSRFAVNPRGQAAQRRRVPRGTKFRFRVSEAGRVRLAVERRTVGRRVSGKCRKTTRRNRSRRKCVRYVTLRRFSRPVKAGQNSISFSGRIRRRGKARSLKPGRYRMALRPVDAAGNRGKLRRVKFRIVRG